MWRLAMGLPVKLCGAGVLYLHYPCASCALELHSKLQAQFAWQSKNTNYYWFATCQGFMLLDAVQVLCVSRACNAGY